MGWFVIGCIIAMIGLLCFIAIPFVRRKSDSPGTDTLTLGVIGSVCVLIFLLFWFIGGLKSVPTKSIGVPVVYGKISGQPYGPGLHPTWQPWLHLAIIDETIQTTTFEVNQQTGHGGLDVRIGGQQTARVDVTIQWRVQDAAADGLFLNYANQGGSDLMTEIRNAVVIRSLKAAANDVMGDYNPIVDVATNATSGNSQFSTFGPKLKAAMIHDIGRRIKVVSLYMPLAHYDPSTQNRLNTIQQQYAQTAIAKQQYQTNLALARANNAIRSSVSSSPGVLIHECLQVVQDAEKSGYQLPAGFGCFGSTNGVVLQQK